MKAWKQRPFCTCSHPTPHPHFLCCFKADAGPHQQGGISHFCSWMLLASTSMTIFRQADVLLSAFRQGQELANAAYASSRQMCRCSGPPWPAKQVSWKTQVAKGEWMLLILHSGFLLNQPKPHRAARHPCNPSPALAPATSSFTICHTIPLHA